MIDRGENLRLTTMSRYGARAVFDIAYHSLGLPVQIKDICKRQKIPQRYLEQIFMRLKQADILGSIRGPKGGYVLKKDPDKITVGDILKAVKDNTYPVFCGDPDNENGRECSKSAQCVTRLIWKEAGEKITQFFSSVTISSLCERGVRLGVRKDMKHSFDYII